MQNNNENYDITTNLENIYLKEGSIFLNPIIIEKNIFNALKKSRVIKELVDTITKDNQVVGIAKINLGIIKKYDSQGLRKHLNNREGKL